LEREEEGGCVRPTGRFPAARNQPLWDSDS
jgi:hypothetical protein